MKVGVIGLGSIGSRHARNLRALGHEVIGYDPSAASCAKYAESGGVCAVSPDEIYIGCQAVIVASPSQYHLQDSLAAVGQGKHVLIEKPLAHTMRGIEDLLEMARSKSLVVALGMNMRFNPAIRRLNEYVQDGKLGRILWANYWHSSYLPDWRPSADYKAGYAADPKSGGVLFDVVHGFDLMQYIFGKYRVAASVAGSSGTLGIPSDDYADVICKGENAANLTLHMDFMTRPKTHLVTVAGENGTVKVDITGRLFVYTGVDGSIVDQLDYSGTPVNDDYIAELDDFIGAIGGKALGGCPLSDGHEVLSQVIAARKMAGLPQHD